MTGKEYKCFHAISIPEFAGSFRNTVTTETYNESPLMIITNNKTGQILNNVYCANSFLSKIIGLMFSKPRAVLMIFQKTSKVSLHTWFVFFPLQIYYMDGYGRVVESTTMNPFSFYSPKADASYILEVPADFDFCAENGDCLLSSTKISLKSEL